MRDLWWAQYSVERICSAEGKRAEVVPKRKGDDALGRFDSPNLNYTDESVTNIIKKYKDTNLVKDKVIPLSMRNNWPET